MQIHFYPKQEEMKFIAVFELYLDQLMQDLCYLDKETTP